MMNFATGAGIAAPTNAKPGSFVSYSRLLLFIAHTPNYPFGNPAFVFRVNEDGETMTRVNLP